MPDQPSRSRGAGRVPRTNPTVLLRLAVGAAVVVLVGVAGLVVAARRAGTPGPVPLASAPLPSQRMGDVYVATTGSDASPGTADAPLASVQAGLDRVQPGATVWLRPGTYDGFAIHRSGLPGRAITVAAVTPGSATIRPVSGMATIDIVDASQVRLLDLVVLGPAGQYGDAVRIDHAAGVDVEGTSIQHTAAGFGIEVRYASGIEIRGNDLAHNAVGIRLFGEGDPGSVHDVVIEDNRIHDNDSMVVNDAAPDNDFGANAIIWHKVTGTTVARGNQIWNSRAQSHDYGDDGGAFEIWGSSNLTITGNTVWDNVNVMETGSDGPPCADITFRFNVAYVTTSGVGLILRCASDSLIANNTLDGLRLWAFDLSDRSGGNRFAESIDGLTIVDNVVVGSALYAIENGLPSSVRADHNLVWQTSGPVAKLPGGAKVRDLSALAAATGLDRDSLSADPRFVDPARHDYRLLPGSPAIDRGVVAVPGDSFQGSAPDLGAFEGSTPLASPS